MLSFAVERVPYQIAMSHSLIDRKDVQVIRTSGLASTEEIDRNDDRRGDGTGCLVYAREGPLPFHYE